MRQKPSLILVCFLAVTTTALSGCGGNAIANLKKRASFDLDCPEGSLRTQELGSGVFGVTGCGRKATYVKVGQPPQTKWVMNTESGGE